jgi:NADH:ubiquinone oxidoreductase subunit H
MVLLERKVLRGIQLRTGPMVVRFFGVLQTLIDGVKLVSKGVYKFNYSGMLFILAGICTVYCDSTLNLFIILVVLGYCFLLRVYSSNNLYALLGRYRAVVVILAFDILIFIILTIDITIVLIPIMIYVFSAEGRRTPIDLVEGESELVSGFNTEYSGIIFVCYFLGEYLVLIVIFCIIIGNYVEIIIISNLFMLIVWRGSYPRMKYNEVVSTF